MNSFMERMNNQPMGDALSYLEAHAKPVNRLTPPMQPMLPFAERYPEEFEWISSSTFDFAIKMRAVLKQWGGLTPNQLSAVRRCMNYKPPKMQGYTENQTRVALNHIAAQQPSVDLTKVPSGMYAVPNGDTRLKVRISRGTLRWQGYIFVNDGAAYGQQQDYGCQKPGYAYDGKIKEQLAIIAADPRAASAAYGKLTGSCGVCGRHLENEESVAAGIGPICAGRMGW